MPIEAGYELTLFIGTDQKETDAVRGMLGRWKLDYEETNVSDDGQPTLLTPAGGYCGYEKIESFCRISEGVLRDKRENPTLFSKS